MSTDPSLVSDALERAALGPARASGDAGSVDNHPLPDLVLVDRYQRAQRAARSPRRGLRFSKLVPPSPGE